MITIIRKSELLTFSIATVLRGIWRVASSDTALMHCFRSLEEAKAFCRQRAALRHAKVVVHDVNGLLEEEFEVNAFSIGSSWQSPKAGSASLVNSPDSAL